MSVRYETRRFLARLVLAVGVAVIGAVIWSLLHGGPFQRAVEVGFYLVGALAFGLAATTMSVPAYAPRSSDNRPDRTLGPVVVLGVIGAILIALGWAIS